jgi:phosphoglycolate phosphatase
MSTQIINTTQHNNTGTLGDDSGSLKKWMNHMTDCFTECLRKNHYYESEISTIIQSLHNRLGWDNSIQNVISSAPLAVGTWEESIETCCNVAELCGLEPRTLPRQWHAKLNNVHGSDPPIIPNLIEMIQSCRDLGLIVAICTSDDRTSTDSAIRNWNISDLIDYSICGDEVGKTPKPSSIPLEILCKRVLGSIKPQECIIVGDTVGDTGMARNAKAGLCIGVLSGSGNEKQLLETGANIIVPNVGHIPELLLNLLIVGRSGSK